MFLATTALAQGGATDCPLDESKSGSMVTIAGNTVQSPHNLAFSVDGCREDILLTFAGDHDNTLPAKRLQHDRNLRLFKKFTDSLYAGTPSSRCNQCPMYGPTQATLVGQLEVIEKGATRDKNGSIRDNTGKIVWRMGFGNPTPLYIYRLVITSVESATAQKLPPPESSGK
jgi:hypothetical protein